jgi:hypothetical protein
MPEMQAEAVIEVLRQAQDAHLCELATKADLAVIKADLAAVKADLKADLAAMRSEMQLMEPRLVIKLGGVMAAIIATATGVILHFLK